VKPNINAYMNGYGPNRMEPEGPSRYLKTDQDIRAYLNKDRKLVATVIMSGAIKVLQNTFKFTDEDLLLFRDELQKEILES
jgi:predicted transcriptional regulator